MTTELQTQPEAPETTFVSYDKPLTLKARYMIDSLMRRYVDDKGQPLVLFDSDPENPDAGWVALHIPRIIRPTYLRNESISAEAQSILERRD